MLIQEIILENFMSYEYARVPLKQGVNVICGPNGAGKSSMLLGISIALGQSQTERSKKLSQLIRWGKDQARITLILDNSPKKGGKRPVQKIKKDQIFLTRTLRLDGKYEFELDNRAVTKADVQRVLANFGVDPDNLLIIMHQNMTEQFTVLSLQEKLRVVEAAVGLEKYRQNVLEAQKKLSRIISQEESVNNLLENAAQTLNYWRDQYDRYQQKKQLQMKRRLLERELAWAEVAKKENNLSNLEAKIKQEQNELQTLASEITKIDRQITESQSKIAIVKDEWKKLLETRLILEREKAVHEVNIQLANQTLKDMRDWIESNKERIADCLGRIQQFETTLGKTATLVTARLAEVKKAYENLETTWTQQFATRNLNLKQIIDNATTQLQTLTAQIAETENKMVKLNAEIDQATNQTIDHKINNALLQYRQQAAQKTLKELETELKNAKNELAELITRAEQTGPRLVPMKNIAEILDEIRLTDGHLAALTDVSEDIERMYENYSKLYLELKEKARLVAENHQKALEEVKTRMESWRTVIQSLLDHVNLQYQAILANAQATGEVRLINAHDIEAAGLEVLVGFKGAKPVPLDTHAQSGGERSTATMSFLLALQQHVRSPFRAVDEYDIHMDPKNREMIANLLIEAVKNLDTQYLAITPSQITFAGKDVHVITVQNIEGKSQVKEVVA
ncbi:MAG: AAA family ATPase [Candidatus Bathyarchaeia archaeon]|jgi:chromosome segregation ATPase|nr:AAA family ATPase [Candidatus Bathyarchaeota archaeon A05DMB-4]MDH7595516.1 AAA family ATPase [Candidatus Bathyarchaeota archaeon]